MSTPAQEQRSDLDAALHHAVRLLNIAFRYRWIILVLPFLAGSISLYRSLAAERSYTSRSTFMTQGGNRPAGTAGLAAQFGINLGPTGDPTLSPEFYADLLKSRPVLERTVGATFMTDPRDLSVRKTLAEFHGGEGRAIDRLRLSIATSIAAKTGVVAVAVRSTNASLAQQINAELLRQLDDFNQGRRKSRVGAERKFTQSRLAEAAADVRAIEDSLQEFYNRNRDFERSPDLRFREDRIARELTRRQAIYSSLAQAYEQAKIDEVRDTPVITVLEEPIPPPTGDSRHTIDRALLAALMATFTALGIALVVEFLKGGRLHRVDELVELKSISRTFVSELRSPIGTAVAFLRNPVAALRRLIS